MFKLCLVVLCLAAAVQGFMPAFRNGRSLMRQMATLESAKDILLSDGGSGLSKAELNEYILKLEKLNPTEDPALSPLLNGVWEVVSSGIFSPGMVGIQAIKSLPGRLISVEDLTITISNEYPRVTAATEVKVGGAKVKVQVVTDLEVESGLRLKESYVSGKIASLEIPLSTIKTYSRTILISYLDDDLLIARNKFGAPEVLKRKEYAIAEGFGVPSVLDDGAPGA